MLLTVVVLALVLLVIGAIALFNRLVADRNQMRAAWSDIDVQLTRRHDLTPQLVTAVQAYADYERTTLAAVSALRTNAVAATDLGERARLEDELGNGIGRLLALVERYPDLKASDNFLQLQRDLVEVEEHLQYARRFYNGAVRDYNDAGQRVPDLLVARGFGFAAAEFYQAAADERAAIAVEMSP